MCPESPFSTGEQPCGEARGTAPEVTGLGPSPNLTNKRLDAQAQEQPTEVRRVAQSHRSLQPRGVAKTVAMTDLQKRQRHKRVRWWMC